MRYEDQQLIHAYAKLGLEIAAAKNPQAQHDVSEAETLRRGYQALKRRMEQLSPKKKAMFRTMMRNEINAVRALMAKAEATGETFTLADISVEMIDAETGQAVPGTPNVQLETESAE
ncbi:MAG TPA: hypothetical protein VMZ53_03720 [Kofleriaceae bacterium]|nr:hypothetical protein [Kofleriaceae bacterium]